MDPFFLLLLFAVLLIPLFLGSRRQKKAVQQAKELQNSLSVGDRVMTTSGMYATVTDIDDEDVIGLEIAPGVETVWVRVAIREKIVDTIGDDVDETAHDEPTTGTTATSPTAGATAVANAPATTTSETSEKA